MHRLSKTSSTIDIAKKETKRVLHWILPIKAFVILLTGLPGLFMSLELLGMLQQFYGFAVLNIIFL